MPRGNARRTRAASGQAKKRASGKSRPGLPEPASVVSVKTFTSPKGTRYRILETDETDPYDPPLRPDKKGS